MSTALIRDRNPINQRFEGSHFHHLHINSNHTLGIYIPDEIHSVEGRKPRALARGGIPSTKCKAQ